MTPPPKCGADGRDAAIGALGKTSIRRSLGIRPVHRFRPNATRVRVSAEMKPVTVAAISGAAILAAATIAPAAESIQSVVGTPFLTLKTPDS